MMYVQYPELSRAEQLAGLDPLQAIADCCAEPARVQDAALLVTAFRVETGLDTPVMRATLPNGQILVLDLTTGRLIDHWPEKDLALVGVRFAANRNLGSPSGVSRVDRDQWTVHGRFNVHRPLVKFRSPDGDEWYVSRRTGDVIQATTFTERFWSWPGAITHWLYPTVLRQHTAAWAQVVIWLTIASLFLTVTGIAIGIKHFRWCGGRRRSPYAGWTLWHHYAGLVFGLMTLIWLASGLASMNPWGALEGRSVSAERKVLNGLDLTLGEAVDAVRSVLPHVATDTVRLESVPWLGAQYFIARNAEDVPTRLSSNGAAPPIEMIDVSAAGARLNLDAVVIDRLDTGDNYYFGHHASVELPVWRILTRENERFYLSPASGAIVAHYDESRRWYRWLFEGLHRGDFVATVRSRPLWDVVMLLLLAGVTGGVATGVYLAWRRITPQ
jgi:hypothetical protein